MQLLSTSSILRLSQSLFSKEEVKLLNTLVGFAAHLGISLNTAITSVCGISKGKKIFKIESLPENESDLKLPEITRKHKNGNQKLIQSQKLRYTGKRFQPNSSLHENYIKYELPYYDKEVSELYKKLGEGLKDRLESLIKILSIQNLSDYTLFEIVVIISNYNLRIQ